MYLLYPAQPLFHCRMGGLITGGITVPVHHENNMINVSTNYSGPIMSGCHEKGQDYHKTMTLIMLSIYV